MADTPELEAIPHEPSVDQSTAPTMGRRKFLEYAGMFVAGVVTLKVTELVLKSPESASNDPERLTKIVEDGFTGAWKEVVLFPGVLVATSGVKVYKEPTLDTEIDEPIKLEGAERLMIQRPFFVNSTLSLYVEGLSYESRLVARDTEVKPGTLGFIHPTSSEFVYLNYNDHAEVLQPHVRQPITHYESEAPLGLRGQQVLLDGYKKYKGQPTAYIDDSYEERVFTQGYATPPEIKTIERLRLCGVSTYMASPEKLANALDAFHRNPDRPDFVTIPSS